MAEAEIALVFSPEVWVEELHRFVTDHGGARVRHVVVDPAVALDEQYQTLVVSWRWPALTRGLVDELHRRGRTVLGVFDREEPVGRELLMSSGVDAVVESDAAMGEFIAVLDTLEPLVGAGAALGTPALINREVRGAWIAVGGPAGGGASELAIELARATPGDVVLVDADEVAPALATRLALSIEPNIRNAIDAVEYGLGNLGDALVSAPGLRAAVLTGLPNVSAWSHIRAPEVLRVLRALSADHDVVIADTSAPVDDLAVVPRGRYAVTRAVLAEAAAVVAVGLGSPVGVVRLLGWIADLQVLRPGLPVHVVLNRAPRDVRRRTQLEVEMQRTFVAESLLSVPDDPRVARAAWVGTPVGAGSFRKGVAPLVRPLVAALREARDDHVALGAPK
jgi:MinD-like ATPase involved in chromosome partitioning or flagellar assembly